METEPMGIGQLIWPTTWMIAAIIGGIVVYSAIQSFKEQMGWRGLQPIALHLIASIVLGAIFFGFTTEWRTAVAALIWALFLPPLGQYLLELLGRSTSWVWEKLNQSQGEIRRRIG